VLRSTVPLESYGKKLRAVECSVLVARMFLFLVSQTNDTCLNSSKSDYKLDTFGPECLEQLLVCCRVCHAVALG
jgi:hypothetical protein